VKITIVSSVKLLTQYLPVATEGNHKILEKADAWVDVWNQDIPNMNQECYVPESGMQLHVFLCVFSVPWTTST
jgi:hypothetical protein